MQETQKHRDAFEEYYTQRNVLGVSRKLGICRQSLSNWKRDFRWKERCEERDRGINEQVNAVMIPQWTAVKVTLIQAFINQINAAIAAGITPADSKDMVAVSKELRALLGEADKHEVTSITKHELSDDPAILKDANDLAKKLSCMKP
jgi:hypothetical protein